ncbi:hypothetical protein B296_00030157 [Ensete ventricosum]|uniref:CBS domain-containing protein n=1 Tax=Ensete ventricosum TaxID=4639 RepID=A0A426Z206_ENSVE|nr:hypothetical protein B296_00030157 [Ensete ventricosum]
MVDPYGRLLSVRSEWLIALRLDGVAQRCGAPFLVNASMCSFGCRGSQVIAFSPRSGLHELDCLLDLNVILPSVGAKNIFFSGGTTNPGVTFPTTVYDNRRSSKIKPSVFSAGDGRPQLDENPEGIISGESAACLHACARLLGSMTQFPPQHCFELHQVGPCSPLREVMSTAIVTATASQMLEEIDHHFEVVSGLPVVDGERRCIGVVSRSDGSRASSVGVGD